MRYGASVHMNSKFLWEGTNTFTNVTTERSWDGNGQHLHVRSLDLTVNDSGGSPLENATVNVMQKEGKEIWNFQTNSAGNILDCNKDLPVFVEKEETSTGNYTQWSNGSGNQTHVITISHPDYKIDTREVAFTEDKTIVAQLSTNPHGTTKIVNSTIKNATIN